MESSKGFFRGSHEVHCSYSNNISTEAIDSSNWNFRWDNRFMEISSFVGLYVLFSCIFYNIYIYINNLTL